MEFKGDSSDFQRIIKTLGIVARTNTTELDGRIYIDASGDKVAFTANNGVTAIRCKSPVAEIVEPGGMSVVYSKLNTFVMSFRPWDGAAGAKNFVFKGDDKELSVSVESLQKEKSSFKGELKLPVMASNFFQQLNDIDQEAFVLNSTVLRRAMNKALYAIDPKMGSDQGALQGMSFKFDGPQIYFAGSNGRVLSEYCVKNHTGIEKEDIILQYDFVTGLRRLLVDNMQLLCETKCNRLAVGFENVLFVGKKIIGYEYPDYRRVFENFEHRLHFPRDILIETLAPLSDILDPEDNFRLTFEIKDKVIRLYNDNASMTLDHDIPGGIDFVIDVNGRILMQSVDAIHDEHVLVKFSNENGVLILDASTTEDQKTVVTPIIRRN